MRRFGIVVTFDERYEFVKLYDILRDMDFELTPLQESVFEKIEMGVDKLKFNVKEVEFDFDDDYANGFKLTFDEEIELRDLALGMWEADDEDDLIEEITAASGWCIKSIDYDIQLKEDF